MSQATRSMMLCASLRNGSDRAISTNKNRDVQDKALLDQNP